MGTIIQSAQAELADNWPAFAFIATTIVFSIFFLRERRAEIKELRQIGAGIHDRIDRVERLLKRRPDAPQVHSRTIQHAVTNPDEMR
jgi:hypothetical protein